MRFAMAGVLRFKRQLPGGAPRSHMREKGGGAMHGLRGRGTIVERRPFVLAHPRQTAGKPDDLKSAVALTTRFAFRVQATCCRRTRPAGDRSSIPRGRPRATSPYPKSMWGLVFQAATRADGL